MKKLTTPLDQKDILELKVGEQVMLSGNIFTARDKAHKFLLKNSFKKINNSIIYHCGPIVKDNKIIAAGPTTSARMSSDTPDLIKKYNIKAIIGKGGMDNSVLEALKGKAVYFSAIGGVAVLYAKAIKIKNVYKTEFGMSDAIWELEIKDFPVVIGIDARGSSLYQDILEKSKQNLDKMNI